MFSFSGKKALLVDMDGTLVDSEEPLYLLYAKTLKKFGCSGSKEEFDELVGPTIREALSVLKKRHSLPPPLEELYASYREGLKALYAEKLPLFDGALELLTSAKGRGMKIALVTASNGENVELLFSLHALHPLFDAVVTPEGERGKPAPDLYLRALSETGSRPSEALAIEDSPNGVLSALSAGIETVQLFGRSLPPSALDNPLLARIECWKTLKKIIEVPP